MNFPKQLPLFPQRMQVLFRSGRTLFGCLAVHKKSGGIIVKDGEPITTVEVGETIEIKDGKKSQSFVYPLAMVETIISLS